MTSLRTRDRFDAEALLKPLSEETQGADGPAVELHSLPEGVLVKASVTAAAGTEPALDLTIQGSDDGLLWADLLTLPTITGAGKTEAPVGPQPWRFY